MSTREPPDRNDTGEPVPKDQKFADWLESLFFDDGNQSPERLEVRVVSGKDHEKLGPIVKQYAYAPPAASEAAVKASIGKAKPKNKTDVVKLSNEILARVQRDCDEGKKPRTYGILASHYSRETDYYERWLKRCTPQGVHSKDGSFEEDDERSMPEKFGTHVLDHHERMFDMYGKMMEGMVDRYDRIRDRDQREIEDLRNRLVQKEDMLQVALSLKEERDAAREWRSIGTKSVERAVNFAIDMAPSAINRLAGKSVFSTKESTESVALRTFFREKKDGGSLTPEQIASAFGVFDDKPPHALLKEGVLKFEQAKLLLDVAKCEVPADDLDKVLPGGPLEITQEQMIRLQSECGFTMEQIGPIVALFGERWSRKKATEEKK